MSNEMRDWQADEIHELQDHLNHAWLKLEAQQEQLANLLAVIHCLGGHYQAEHGTVEAVEEAKATLFREMAELSEVRSEEAPRIKQDWQTAWERSKRGGV
jgi:chromosome segregation ATPase